MSQNNNKYSKTDITTNLARYLHPNAVFPDKYAVAPDVPVWFNKRTAAKHFTVVANSNAECSDYRKKQKCRYSEKCKFRHSYWHITETNYVFATDIRNNSTGLFGQKNRKHLKEKESLMNAMNKRYCVTPPPKDDPLNLSNVVDYCWEDMSKQTPPPTIKQNCMKRSSKQHQRYKFNNQNNKLRHHHPQQKNHQHQHNDNQQQHQNKHQNKRQPKNKRQQHQHKQQNHQNKHQQHHQNKHQQHHQNKLQQYQNDNQKHYQFEQNNQHPLKNITNINKSKYQPPQSDYKHLQNNHTHPSNNHEYYQNNQRKVQYQQNNNQQQFQQHNQHTHQQNRQFYPRHHQQSNHKYDNICYNSDQIFKFLLRQLPNQQY